LGEGKRFWIFQANPKYYDIDSAVRELSDQTWLVGQSNIGSVASLDLLIKRNGVSTPGIIGHIAAATSSAGSAHFLQK
jgi:hypothetical protein